MNRLFVLTALLAVAAFGILPAVAQQESPALPNIEPPPLADLLAQKAPTIVTVKFVLKIQIPQMGQDMEESQEVRGTLVGERGLVLVSSSSFEGGLPAPLMRMLGGQMDVKATPSDLKVIFANETEEYDAQLVAKDSNLGLAFVQITDLGDRDVPWVDLTPGTAKPAIGMKVVCVSRLSRAFDFVPALGTGLVIARIEKPRAMWGLEAGGAAAEAHPVYDRFGRPIGVLSLQEGSGGMESPQDQMGMLRSLGNLGDSMMTAILPLEDVHRSLKAAEKRAEEALAGGGEEAGDEKPVDEPMDEPTDD